MQKGFATFEIIFATLIIAVLATVVFPNANRMIDRVALDYETKKIYTEMRALQSLERMTNMRDAHFGTTDDNPILLIVYPDRYVLEKRDPNKTLVEHYFSHGVTSDNNIWQIRFDDSGRISNAISNHLTLTSGQGKKFYIIFDSVGRFRGGREEP